MLAQEYLELFVEFRRIFAERLIRQSKEPILPIIDAAVVDAFGSKFRAIMKIVMPKLKGEADGAVVNRIVRELLG